MAERQQQQEARAPERHPSEGPEVPIVEPRTSQAPMAATQDEQRDSMGNDTVSNSRATTDPVWSCESTRDAHEFIRKVNGRQFQAQNSVYFLPAGESSKFPANPPSLYHTLSCMRDRPLHGFSLRMDFLLLDHSSITYYLFPLCR